MHYGRGVKLICSSGPDEWCGAALQSEQGLQIVPRCQIQSEGSVQAGHHMQRASQTILAMALCARHIGDWLDTCAACSICTRMALHTTCNAWLPWTHILCVAPEADLECTTSSMRVHSETQGCTTGQLMGLSGPYLCHPCSKARVWSGREPWAPKLGF